MAAIIKGNYIFKEMMEMIRRALTDFREKYYINWPRRCFLVRGKLSFALLDSECRHEKGIHKDWLSGSEYGVLIFQWGAEDLHSLWWIKHCFSFVTSCFYITVNAICNQNPQHGDISINARSKVLQFKYSADNCRRSYCNGEEDKRKHTDNSFISTIL